LKKEHLSAEGRLPTTRAKTPGADENKRVVGDENYKRNGLLF